MKIINGCRRSGKSYKILEQLTERDLFISSSYKMIDITYRDWISIHHPSRIDFHYSKTLQNIRPTFTTLREIQSGRFRGTNYKFEKVFIDNLDLMIDDFLFVNNINIGCINDIICTTGAEIELLPIPEEVKKLIAEHPDVDFIGNTTVAE